MCLIYLLTLTCNHCRKRHVGETTDSSIHRWNGYKSNKHKFPRNETCMQEHFLKNVSTLINKRR